MVGVEMEEGENIRNGFWNDGPFFVPLLLPVDWGSGTFFLPLIDFLPCRGVNLDRTYEGKILATALARGEGMPCEVNKGWT